MWEVLVIYLYPKIDVEYLSKFPSPVGVFFLLIKNQQKFKESLKLGFHPLSGFSSYLFIKQFDTLLFLKMFPSPVGVFFLLILPFGSHYSSLFQRSIACETNLSPLFNDNTLQNSLQLPCNVHRVKTNQLSYIIPSGKDFPNSMYTSMYAVILPALHHLY